MTSAAPFYEPVPAVRGLARLALVPPLDFVLDEPTRIWVIATAKRHLEAVADQARQVRPELNVYVRATHGADRFVFAHVTIAADDESLVGGIHVSTKADGVCISADYCLEESGAVLTELREETVPLQAPRAALEAAIERAAHTLKADLAAALESFGGRSP